MADGRVEYEVRANTSHLQSDLNAANQVVRNAAQQTQNTVNEVSNAASGAFDGMTNAAQQTAESIDELGESADEASNGVSELGNNAQQTSRNVNGLGQSSEDAAKKTEKLKDSVGKVKDSLKDAKETIEKYTAVVGGALTAVGTAAIKSAADAETSFAKVKTLLSDGTAFDEYQQSIKAASEATGVAFKDMAESVYSAISASVDQEYAVDFAQNAVKLAKGGFTEAATAVDVLTTAINAYGLEADDAAHISDVLITTQNLGKTTVDELAHSMGQTIPIANSAGVAIEELSTAYAVMTKNGVATAEAGTQIKAMLNELNASGTTVDKTLREVAGKSFSQLKAEGQTTADVLNTLKDYAQSSGQQLSDLFGSVEAGAAALTLVKDGGKDFADILNAMEASAGAAEKAYETMANTVEERLNKLKNRFTLALADMGEELLPVVEKFADYIDDNFDEISETVGELGKAVEGAAEFLLSLTKVLWENKEAVAAAVAGYVAFKTAMAVGAVIAEVVNAIKAMKAATESATVAQGALNAVCNANPYVLLASAIIGVVTALGTFAAAAAASGDAIRDLKNAQDEALKSMDSSIAANEAEMRQLQDKVARYDELRGMEERTAGQERELKTLSEELQKTLGNDVEVVNSLTGEYNDLTLSVEKYIEAQKRQAKAAAYEDYLKDLYSQIAQAEMQMEKNAQEYAEEMDRLSNLASNNMVRSEINIEKTRFEKQQKELENFIADCESQIDDISGKISDFYEETAGGAEEAGNEVSGAAEDAANNVSAAEENAADSASEFKSQLDELNESTQSLIKQYGGLYDSLKTLQNGGALTYDQMQSLIDIYPDLAEQINVTADGYTLEAQALDELGNALDESVNNQIEAEKAKTEAAIQGAKDRISVLNAEMAALAANGEYSKANEKRKQADAARAEIAGLEQKLPTYVTLGDYLKSSRGRHGSSSGSSSSGGGGSSSGSAADPGKATSGKGGNADNETEFDAGYDTLKHQKTMGEITDAEYYRSLKSLQAAYLEPDSKKWRTIDEELHKMDTEAQNANDRKRTEDQKAAQKANEEKYDSEVEKLDKLLKSGDITNVDYWEERSKLAVQYLTEGGQKSKSESRTIVRGKEEAKHADWTKIRTDKEFERDMSDSDTAEDDFYSWLAENYEDYLDVGSDEWRNVRRELKNHADSKNKTSSSSTTSFGSKLGSSGNIIKIDSYIPTVWDSEEEADKKLQAAVGLELAGNSNYAHNIEGDLSTVSTDVTSAAAMSGENKETSLSDILDAINELKKSDEQRTISLDLELKARELTIGTVAYKDINDITKMNGKSPLIG